MYHLIVQIKMMLSRNFKFKTVLSQATTDKTITIITATTITTEKFSEYVPTLTRFSNNTAWHLESDNSSLCETVPCSPW